jgi:hypothetical protein
METLLMVFIGLVAVALVVIAAGVGAVAWYLVRLLRELDLLTRRLHEAGELVADDLALVRRELKLGMVPFIYKLIKYIWPKRTTLRKSPPPQE